jgi:hypothetical protein
MLRYDPDIEPINCILTAAMLPGHDITAKFGTTASSMCNSNIYFVYIT